MRILLVPALLLSACSQSSDVLEELPNSSLAGAPREEVPETRLETRLTRAVTIGENGPNLDACGGLGQVGRVGARGVAVRAAPFTHAQEIGRMAVGDRAWVCTRSLDQKWLGIVIAPVPQAGDDGDPIDCGVTQPVDRRQPYDGPCQSGWVSSAAIELIAG